MNRDLDAIQTAWAATPRDLFSAGRKVQNWASHPELVTALGYHSLQRLFSSELPGIDLDWLFRSALFFRLVEEGGYARPTDDAELVVGVPSTDGAALAWRRVIDCSLEELERAVPYAASHGKPPIKPPPPKPPPPLQPPPDKPPPPAKPSRWLTPGRVIVGLVIVAAILIYRFNAPPTQAPPRDWNPPALPPAPPSVSAPVPPPDAGHPAAARPHTAPRSAPTAEKPAASPPAPVPDPLGGKEKDLSPEQLERILERERREERPPVIQ
jgi:hypothetical protein